MDYFPLYKYLDINGTGELSKQIDLNCSSASIALDRIISEELYEIEIFTNGLFKYRRNSSKAVEVSVSGRSLRLRSWIWVTSIFCSIAIFFKFHEVQPTILITLILTNLFILIYRLQNKVISEKLLVVSGFGVQTTLTYLTGKCMTRFIPWVRLIDIIIAESITMQQVLFFMAILVKSESDAGKEELYPLFLHTWPKLYCLQEIYRYCQETIRSSSLKQIKILNEKVQ